MGAKPVFALLRNLDWLRPVMERRLYCRRAEGAAMKQGLRHEPTGTLPLPPQEWGGSLTQFPREEDK